ncbi:MAG: hypothetical protein L0K86_00080 [Actinomycetia bacterium]|nr:hypothetical protein [Actinomycetes bacterium]
MTITHQDEFLLDLYDLDPAAVRRALARRVSRYRRQNRNVIAFVQRGRVEANPLTATVHRHRGGQPAPGR